MVVLTRFGASVATIAALGGCATTATTPYVGHAYDAPIHQPPPPPAPGPGAPPPAMQYLYGSAEAAALSLQAYHALVDTLRQRMAAKDRSSALIFPEGRDATPTPLACAAGMPPAIVLDMDETAILNLGYEYDDALTGSGYDAARWRRWEETGGDKVAAVPGAAAAFADLRRLGLTIVFNSNRNAASAPATEAALRTAGLGDFRHGDTLFLKGDADGGSAKDARRRMISKRFCVMAMGGDQFGDFTDIPAAYTPGARRTAATTAPYDGYWGRRWFMLPNPVYGSGLGSGWADTFPSDKRWSPPAP